MTLYFDTSALVKYFHNENGSPAVINLIDEPNNIIWISELAVIEIKSALHKKYRMGAINLIILQEVLQEFNLKVLEWHVEPFTELQTEEANRLIIDYGRNTSIRTLDALQLAAFNLLKQPDWEFVVADIQLQNVAMADSAIIRAV